MGRQGRPLRVLGVEACGHVGQEATGGSVAEWWL